MRNRRDESIDSVIIRIKNSFASVYLSLTSIIQAAVFAYLIFILDTYFSELHLCNVMPLICSFLLIVITWNEYMMGATAFVWIPKIIDSFIPFLLGIFELLVCRSAVMGSTSWYFFVSVFGLIATLAYSNMYRSAKQHAENNIVFELLHRMPRITFIWTLCHSFIFLMFGLILLYITSNLVTLYIIQGLSLGTLIAFLYRGVKYWNRIVGERQCVNIF